MLGRPFPMQKLTPVSILSIEYVWRMNKFRLHFKMHRRKQKYHFKNNFCASKLVTPHTWQVSAGVDSKTVWLWNLRPTENVINFKHLGTTVTNKNYPIRNEVNMGLGLEDFCCRPDECYIFPYPMQSYRNRNMYKFSRGLVWAWNLVFHFMVRT